MKRALLVSMCLMLAACAGARGPSKLPGVADAERMHTTLAGRDAQTLSPQAFAEAEASLRAAHDAESRGDETGAELHGELAIAGYQRAIALARLARATADDAQAHDALARANEQSQKWASARMTAEREADDLEKQLRVAREAQSPIASGPADGERERARLVAAQALAAQARLLCSAARLVSPQAAGLAEAETGAADLEKKIDASPRPAPIDAAARTRAACLTSLTKARRAGAPESDRVDTLLAELSQSAEAKTKSASDFAPARDERGVVVTLRSVFKGDKLTPEAEASLKDLGRVAGAHQGFGVQVVLHDATPPSPTEVATNKVRGDAVASALQAGGASSAKMKVEQVGARAPIVDPKDTQRRERNARVEIVFVPGT